jgi:hypothetical protein
MSEPKDIPDFFSQLGSSVFTQAAIHAIRENGNPTDISPGLLSQLAPGVLASLAQRNVIPYHLGFAASHAASVATGKISPAVGGAWISQSLIRASIDDTDARVQALRLPYAIDQSVQSYESLQKTFKEEGMLRGSLSLPFHMEDVAHQWLRTLHLPTPSKRIWDHIWGLVGLR